MGLLLLRTVAGAVLIWNGSMRWTDWQEPKVPTLALAFTGIVSGLSLLLGSGTPVAAGVGMLTSAGTAIASLSTHGANVTAAGASAAFTAVIALALISLGPGAYSLDARRHGRREIIIPAGNKLPSRRAR